jgi:signal transduction protein with GAF and PtsI domain
MQTTSEFDLVRKVENILIREGAGESSLLQILDTVLSAFKCPTGTIHRWDPKRETLTLQAHRGIPAVVVEKVVQVPIGKGMAGIAAQRKEPVQVCNLQTDTSGVVRPGAKETQMAGSVAVPMLVDGRLRGVLGVAKPEPYDFQKAELDLLLQLGAVIGKHLGGITRQELLDNYFVEHRFKLIEIAAFLDRLDRADGEDDFRIKQFRQALKELDGAEPGRARRVLMAFSDPTTEPIPDAKGKGAFGAWPGK